MKEKPILFRGEMVRAILDGRKTQTRRVVKTCTQLAKWNASPSDAYDVKCVEGGCFFLVAGDQGWTDHIPCPYGQPGDRLWVRETFKFQTTGANIHAIYEADLGNRLIDPPENWDGVTHDNAWRPSIHMPRWASRITLEIVAVRVERLWSISRGDEMAEGCPYPNMGAGISPVVWYSELWESINGQGSWIINPWVWVIEFKRLEEK